GGHIDRSGPRLRGALAEHPEAAMKHCACTVGSRQTLGATSSCHGDPPSGWPAESMPGLPPTGSLKPTAPPSPPDPGKSCYWKALTQRAGRVPLGGRRSRPQRRLLGVSSPLAPRIEPTRAAVSAPCRSCATPPPLQHP